MSALHHIHKSLNGKVVLNDITLDLQKGSINCLLGPSGCGKSTLLRVAAGLLPPDSGCVSLDPSRCAIVFQEPRLLPWLTVAENLSLALPSALSRAQRLQAIAQVLQRMQLDDIQTHMPSELSGGMAQRIGIARALLRQPQTLLMDEPFAALDAITRSELQRMLMQLIKDQHITCLFVTHDINEAITIGDQISIMRHGRIAHSMNNSHVYPDLNTLKHQILEHLHPKRKQ